MEQAILAMLGIIITLMLYLDRGRRADDAMIRKDMNDGNAQIRKELNDGLKAVRAENAQFRQDMNDGNARLRQDMNDGNAQLRQDMNDSFKQVHSRLDKLTDIVMDLCRRVGRLEGRGEVFGQRPDTAQ
ncbi:MAG: hypothetical protein OXT07_04390 [bacterium]|nr:hypothetical protein [bacterium]